MIANEKFTLLEELVEVAERGFLFKLTKSNPDLLPEEINAKVRAWYHDRPGAPDGDLSGGRKITIRELRARAKTFSKKS